MNKAIRYFTFFALSTIHAYAIGADLLTSIEADSRKANQDCVSSIDANATVSKLDEKLTSQNRESICLNKVPTNSNDKVQTQAEAKSFCMCIEQHLKKPIGHRRLTYIDSMIKASAEKTKAVYYMEKILSSRLLVKNLLESSMAKSYLKSDSSFDTASTCSMQYLKASLAKAMDKEVTGCTYEKVDKVINSIREDPHIKADHTLNKSLNKLPKNTKKLLEGVEADVERYAGWDEKLLNAFKQMMSLYSLEKDGKIASARADIETRANMIESVTVILSESSVLNDIKLTFPSGGVINPEGSTDITEYLAADVTNRQMMLTGDKLYATAATHQALADAFRKASLKNTLENTITKAKCDDIVADYTEMCNAFDNDDRFQHQVLAEDLLRSSGPIPSDHIVVPDDINAVGAIQCYMAGLSHSTLDSKAKAYAELNMTELMAVEANLGVGVHLRNPKRYLDMLNKGINKAPGAASGSVDMKALTERFNKAEEREKVFGKRLQGVNFGNLINEKGEATYENSTFADPTPDHTPPFVTPLNKPSEILTHSTDPTNAAPLDQTAQVDEQNQVSGFINPLTIHNKILAKKKTEESPLRKETTKELSGYDKFEEKLSRMFSGKESEDKKSEDTTSRAQKAKDSYRDKTTYKNEMSKLRDEIDQLKKDKVKPTEVIAATPPPRKLSSAPGTEFAPVATNSSVAPLVSAPQAPSPQAVSQSSAPASSSRVSQGPVANENAGVKTRSIASSGSKGSAGNSGLKLSREEIEESNQFIISTNNFDANDQGFIKDLFQKTHGEPIYLSSTDEQGNEKFIMLEAVEKDDGTIEYIPVKAEVKDIRLQKNRGTKSKKKGKAKRSRIKVQDLNSLLGDKL